MTGLHWQAATFAVRGHRLVDDVTVTSRPHRVLGIVGPNGAGKSTLLRLGCGLLAPTRGRIMLDDRDVHSLLPSDRAKKVSYVGRITRPLYDVSARDVVSLGLRSRPTPLPLSQERQLVDEAMARFGLGAIHDRSALILSDGELQRVHVARSWLQAASHWLLDEPTSNQDLGHVRRVVGSMREYASEGRSVVAVFHDVELAASVCDEVALMSSGAIISYGAPRDVLTTDRLSAAYACRVQASWDDGGLTLRVGGDGFP